MGRGEVDPTEINSAAFAVRPPLPGRPGYFETIKYIDDGVKYIDPYAEFFISFDGEMCFRGLVNRRNAVFENYQNYWCIPPSAVNNVEAIENNVSYVNTRFAYGARSEPRNAPAASGFRTFSIQSNWIGNSVSAQTVPFKGQRGAIEYLIYLMGGNAAGAQPLR